MATKSALDYFGPETVAVEQPKTPTASALDSFASEPMRETPQPATSALESFVAEQEPEAKPSPAAESFQRRYGGQPSIPASNADTSSLSAPTPQERPPTGGEPLPEGTLRNLPQAFQDVMTKDTYVGQQALRLTTQVMDFFPRMLRGARANVKKALEATIGKEATAAFRKYAKFTPGAAIVGESVDLDKLLDKSGKLRADVKTWLDQSAYEKGGKFGAITTGLVEAVKDTLMNLQFFKALNVSYGGKTVAAKLPAWLQLSPENLVKVGKSWNVVKGALTRAGILTATREQSSFKDAAAGFGISLAYQSTPAISGWIKNNIGAVSADIIQNWGISATQVKGVLQSAKQQAMAEGKPDKASLYAMIGLIQMFGSDVVFGAITRSFNDKTPARVRESVEKAQATSQEIAGKMGEQQATKQPPAPAAKPLEQARAVVDAAKTLPEKQAALDKWKAENPEAVREIETEDGGSVAAEQAAYRASEAVERGEARGLSQEEMRPLYAELEQLERIAIEPPSPLSLLPDGTLAGEEVAQGELPGTERVEPETRQGEQQARAAVKQEMVERGRPELNDMDRAQLQQEAKRLGLSTRGKNRNLRERIAGAQEGDRTRARQFLQTMQNQAGLPQGAMDELSRVEPQSYEQTKTKQITQQVRTWLDQSPANVEESRVFIESGEPASAAKGAVFSALIDKYQADGNWAAERDVVDAYDKQLRESGRFVQAASNVAAMSGKAFLRHAERFWESHKAKVSEDVKEQIRQEYAQSRRIQNEDERMRAVANVIERVAAMCPTTWKDWVGNFRYTNMLSNPQSHERNVHGNLFQSLISQPLTYAGTGKVKQAGQYEVAALKALPNAFQAFVDAWRSGDVNQKWFEASQQYRDQFESARMRQGAAGTSLSARTKQSLTYVGRFLEAQDKFFAAMIEAGETARLVKQGTPLAEAVTQAKETAQDMLYRTPLGQDLPDKNKAWAVRGLDKLGKLMEVARKGPLGSPVSWMIPFVRTPINIGKKMVQFSPLGYIKGKGGKLNEADLGRANVGSVVTLMGALLAAQGLTTGSPPKDPEERRLWFDSGRRPWSIRIKDKWIPMFYFGSLAGALAIPAAVRDAWVDDPKSAASGNMAKLTHMTGGMARFFTSQTPLTTVGDLMEIVTGRGDVTVQGAIAFAGGQFVPASGFLRWVNQLMIDPVYRRSGDFKESVMKDYPFLSKRTRPYLTSEGQEVTRKMDAVLLPYPTGTMQPEFKQKLMGRNELLKMRRRNDHELDSLVKMSVRGQVHESQIEQWIATTGKEEESRLWQRYRQKMEEWGKTKPTKPSAPPPLLKRMTPRTR